MIIITNELERTSVRLWCYNLAWSHSSPPCPVPPGLRVLPPSKQSGVEPGVVGEGDGGRADLDCDGGDIVRSGGGVRPWRGECGARPSREHGARHRRGEHGAQHHRGELDMAPCGDWPASCGEIWQQSLARHLEMTFHPRNFTCWTWEKHKSSKILLGVFPDLRHQSSKFYSYFTKIQVEGWRCRRWFSAGLLHVDLDHFIFIMSDVSIGTLVLILGSSYQITYSCPVNSLPQAQC